MERKTTAKVATSAYLLLVAGILVIANILSYNSYKRIDMTAEQRFTLSEGSKRLVCEGLKSDLQVDVYVTRGMASSP